jgi:hypothetical protein
MKDQAAAGAAPRQPGEIKIVGKSGQISLGKRYTGKTFHLQQRPDGSLLLTAVAMVPESQLWTLREPDRSAIARGLAWAAATPPAESDLAALESMAAKASRRTRPGSVPSRSRGPRPRAGAK